MDEKPIDHATWGQAIQGCGFVILFLLLMVLGVMAMIMHVDLFMKYWGW